MTEERDCCCKALADFAVIPMGGNGLDTLVFASFKRIKEHGGDQWWLSISTCRICAQDWMVAQDERIYDNFYLRRIAAVTKQEVIEWALWPNEFLTYERVLRLGRKTGQVCRFYDPNSPALVTTVADLQRERPDITAEEIADLLGISIPHVVSLAGNVR